MEQQRLYRLSVDALTISAHHELRKGWTLSIGARHGDETWAEVDWHKFDHLTTPELYDVICADLAKVLGLGC